MIPFFLTIRELDNYSMLYGDERLEKAPLPFQWFMHNRQERIERNIPYLAIDFSRYE